MTATDWSTEWDHTSPEYAAAAPEIWDDLRGRCPVAHTEKFGGAWLPTRHEDVSAIAHDTTHFSSESIIVSDFRPEGLAPAGFAPPITSDPPFHASARRILLPAFAPKAIEALEPITRKLCNDLLDTMLAGGDTEVDAALAYTQHIPVQVIAEMLGLPPEDGDKFRVFIHRILETPGQNGEVDPGDTLFAYLSEIINQKYEQREDDLISFLLDADMDGVPLTGDHVGGTVGLLLIAGIDTTWSAIGAALWHLAGHPEDRRRLATEPDLLPFAVEEFLRFYAPVTMARIVRQEVQVGDVTMCPGDWTLLPFPSANRDPEFFERADEFVIDRQRNRHSAFGLGIHRCVGSNLARMELTVAIDEWMKRIPDFELADPEAVRWSTGQVRGPRTLPLTLLSSGLT